MQAMKERFEDAIREMQALDTFNLLDAVVLLDGLNGEFRTISPRGQGDWFIVGRLRLRGWNEGSKYSYLDSDLEDLLKTLFARWITENCVNVMYTHEGYTELPHHSIVIRLKNLNDSDIRYVRHAWRTASW